MVKYKWLILTIIAAFFLFISFYPTIFELQRANALIDKNREFILEHNFYWPDFNLSMPAEIRNKSLRHGKKSGSQL